ncbi:hypothetical protein [Spiribacter roseus]|uniref:GNAT family N-acetyltransferase n=1 Tax=Spiribacter roseus TaxID=1855875 RepID=A0ABV3RZT2_9GAMM
MIGYKSIVYAKVVWRRHYGVLVPVQMPHAIPDKLSSHKVRLGLVRTGSMLGRWEELFDQVGETDWWHIIKDDLEDLSNLSSNTRSKVRRGLKNYQVAPESRQVVVNEGYEVYRAAFRRYRTFDQLLSALDFQDAVESLPAQTEFWVARSLKTGQMVAFSENLVRDGAVFYDTIWFNPTALKSYVGYALFHEMNKHYLNGRGFRYVSDGARSISHQTNVHQFLQEKFGFRRAYARLRVAYAPGIGMAVVMLYPFRRWIEKSKLSLLQKISIVLEQERIRRACANVKILAE